MRNRRPLEEFSMSFLDVICCGFGAVILLLMITKVVEPIVLEKTSAQLEGLVADLQKQLFTIRGETRVLNRDLNAKREQLSIYQEKIARLQGDFNQVKTRQQTALLKTKRDTEIGKLSAAKQTLTEEMRRLLAEQERKTDLIAGIPVDSEYIIFVIDTSGSMFQAAWPKVLTHLEATLTIYPKVKGIQVMNDMGEYMFSSYRGRWIPDTPARRQAIIKRLQRWNAFSNSSPVEGIAEAIKTYYAKDKRISIYVFGDEYTGQSIEHVVNTVDRLNRRTRTGERRVRIHAVGFPVMFARPQNYQVSGIRFATLMRELTHRNGGTFVGLNDFR